eukprot:CAMPEP_0203919512 /NCGR_PEP_ID=MMETSP0359-20131031/59910_1 /ASSEMBLY_ACC=CAM_ASM_000338 /TAXON_ID=268821 /ORGANISM="Scrippsiella Hangoei, Strain SHTV-5" /LENGTH=165 /DNA_ID=CAMNT_0050846815 /DNA_START=65 /DNA_END=559 /DNA_ORIENTATION=-
MSGVQQTTNLNKAMAGSFAMLLECVVMNPLDVAKTRFQLSTGRSGSVSLAGVLRDLWTSRALWRGLAPAAAMQLPRGALKFTVADSVRARFSGLPAAGLVGGFAAGSLEAVLITPFECVKVRLQSAVASADRDATRRALMELLREEGAPGLARGLEATIWRNGLW